MKRAVTPMDECRDDRAIFAGLAARLGINDNDFTVGRDQYRHGTG